jgi:hypothetical protein
MTPADLATLSLLDPEQGVCPSGHPCVFDGDWIGRRRCSNGEYVGLALICWEITLAAIEQARGLRADPVVIEWAQWFLAERGMLSA